MLFRSGTGLRDYQKIIVGSREDFERMQASQVVPISDEFDDVGLDLDVE